MPKDQQPLLSQDRASSDQSSERQIEEEDALLTGEQKPQSNKYGWPFWREVSLFVWAVLATALVIVLAVLFQHQKATGTGDWGKDGKPSGKRNLIFMVSDGMGPSSLSLTRSFRQSQSGLPIDDILVLDPHVIGTSRTRSSSSLITDSAAGATAFSCGQKSYNGAISVLPDHTPCGSVMEAAKRAGYKTGLVVTTRITDATPAVFASHVNKRDEEDRIAEQMIGHNHPLGHVVDLMFGGGRCHFLPNSTKGSCRDDTTDVTSLAKDAGYSYISTREDFDGLSKTGSAINLPLLGLFASTDIPYEIDRAQPNQSSLYPSLAEMSLTALHALSAATETSDQGFFLMIEGSRIDHAGHGNDPVAQVHEVLAYDAAFAEVLDFLEQDTTPGVVVGTSDHETGGLATARQLHDDYPIYHWFPAVLANASHSVEHLAHEIHEHVKIHVAAGTDAVRTWLVSQIIELGLGIWDYSDAEIDRLMDKDDPWSNHRIMADMISRRAQVGWSTHGHSAVDVNIYASRPEHARSLVGNRENTEVGVFLREFLGVEGLVEEITEELKGARGVLGLGDVEGFGDDFRGDGHKELDHYVGDFRKRKRSSHGGEGCDCGL